jgi:hypothetical protein
LNTSGVILLDHAIVEAPVISSTLVRLQRLFAAKGPSVNGYFVRKVVSEYLILLCLPLCQRPLLNLHNWGTYLSSRALFDSKRLGFKLIILFGEGHKLRDFGLILLNLYDVVKVHGLFQRILFGLAVFTN